MIGSNFKWESNDKNRMCSECSRVGLAQMLVSRDSYDRVRKVVCSEDCRQEFDARYWQGVVDEKKYRDDSKQMKREYTRGFKDAMRCYAWWKDGREYVGTSGHLLKDEITKLRDNPYYKP
ncbi:MAG: hypothetical protein ACW99G_17360 [Candidatus Thorarchaeota archaeon]|jgi:hypothetical protein